MGMKKYKVTFHDIFEAESEADCFAQLIQGMWDVVYHDDVTAFEIEEVEGADEKSKRVLNEIQARLEHPDVTA